MPSDTFFCLKFAISVKQPSSKVIYQFPNHVRQISPGKVKGAIHISCFVGNIFMKFGEGGGSRQVEGEPLVDCLRAGGVLNYTQHSGLLSCILDLRIKKNGKNISMKLWLHFHSSYITLKRHSWTLNHMAETCQGIKRTYQKQTEHQVRLLYLGNAPVCLHWDKNGTFGNLTLFPKGFCKNVFFSKYSFKQEFFIHLKFYQMMKMQLPSNCFYFFMVLCSNNLDKGPYSNVLVVFLFQSGKVHLFNIKHKLMCWWHRGACIQQYKL